MSTAVAVWVRMIPVRWEDAWLERLAWAGPENCVFNYLPGRKSARLEVYGLSARDLAKLRKEFGGSVRKSKTSDWMRSQKHTFCLPLPPRLCLASSDKAVPAKHRLLPRLIIPAGMAFGTGEHATTAMCLRQMMERLPGTPAHILDAGTGSGILALAAALCGHKVTGLDFDPQSIETAKENAARNPKHRSIRWICGDVLKFKPREHFDLITANLFSSLLVQALPLLRKWLKKEGTLILSGILLNQEKEVLAAAKRQGFVTRQRLRKGKWVCLVLQ